MTDRGAAFQGLEGVMVYGGVCTRFHYFIHLACHFKHLPTETLLIRINDC